jgi:opacity protein-like surface antigen
MKASLLITLIFLPLLGYSQDKIVDKIRVGINLSPNYSYRNLRYAQILENVVQAREENEQAAFGYNAGVFARYSVFQKFELEFGIQYANQSHQFKNVTLANEIGAPIGTSDSRCNYNYVELPLRINYKFHQKEKLAIYSTIGASANFFINSTTLTQNTLYDGTKSRDKEVTPYLTPNRSTISFLFGIGVNYPLTEKLNLRFEPILRYSLTPLADAPILQYNYSLGGQFSVSMPL